MLAGLYAVTSLNVGMAPVVAMVALGCAYLVVLLFGAPFYLIVRRQLTFTLGRSLLTGAFVAMVLPAVVMAFLLLGGSGENGGEFARFVVFLGCIAAAGAAGGGVFWLITRPDASQRTASAPPPPLRSPPPP